MQEIPFGPIFAARQAFHQSHSDDNQPQYLCPHHLAGGRSEGLSVPSLSFKTKPLLNAPRVQGEEIVTGCKK